MNDNYYSLNKAPGYYIDWTLILCTVGLVTIGLISIYSATYDSGMTFFNKQLISALLGFGLMTAIAYFPEDWLRVSSYGVYAGSIVLLIAVAIFGVEINGTKGWIHVGGMSLQPAEFAKMGVLMMIAMHLSKKGTDIRTIRDLGIVFGYAALPVALIMKQPDFGTATVILMMILGVVFWTGFDAFIIYTLLGLPIIIISSLKGQLFFIASAIGLTAGAVMFKKNIAWTIAAGLIFTCIGFASPFIYENMLKDHQKARIDTFLNPEANPRGAGYNVIQSKMTVGSGGLTGKGFLQGTQTQLRYVPMQWTDFIYSVPNEEFGFIGGATVILLMMGLIWRTIETASAVSSRFQSILAIGAAAIFIYHSLINIGMAIGLMPVMGIPLPFMSYGGTSILVNLMIVGLILNAHRNYRLKRTV